MQQYDAPQVMVAAAPSLIGTAIHGNVSNEEFKLMTAWGWTVFPLQSTSGRHFVARPSHGHVPCLATRVVSLLLLQFAVLQVMVRARR